MGTFIPPPEATLPWASATRDLLAPFPTLETQLCAAEHEYTEKRASAELMAASTAEPPEKLPATTSLHFLFLVFGFTAKAKKKKKKKKKRDETPVAGRHEQRSAGAGKRE